ncbi:MAG: amino acid adenylation domain-containing protein [Candidatus Pristimantibacillus lignocellulolyticus]|uniref:Amino acid adenylation domain-containing protein n=1 Tax=Candidatus Pristimantibacillus lignocellulolyticus TaxID=2994561 RepID=A0A9J6ZDI7_9BACL|nr:MAG: amino acid adenylation domain-containing protein [Candidatus Pristimantibacillus lignocellulolyticus]
MLQFQSIQLEEENEAAIEISEISNKDIAIIGMSAKLPHAKNLEQFWENLEQGLDCIGPLPENRLQDIEEYMRRIGIDQKSAKLLDCAFLDDISMFDYSFFRLSPKEASLMNPNQRMFLQTAWHTIEDAGYGGDALRGSRTGVFLGYNADSFHDYKRMIEALDLQSLGMAIPGNLSSMIASRISYLLDFKGPALMVDTACSSSLVAFHLACQAIRNGECELALVGSSKIYTFPVDVGISVGIESADGRAKPFDNDADGTGGGEGIVGVLLKPLHKALKDGDSIYAVVKGSATNQDGSSIGITAPNAAAQEDVIVRAWQDANVEPETISYIEAHGTGTVLGDPIEIDGITRAFRNYTEANQFCAVGSVKSNIGHLDHAAGLASLVKTVFALKKRKLPPTIHFTQPNSAIDFIRSPVYVNERMREWEAKSGIRRAGVSAFGMSGTNCHIILEESLQHTETKEIKELKQSPSIFTLSAESYRSLLQMTNDYISFFYQEDAMHLSIRDVCFTSAVGRGHYKYRFACIVEDIQDLLHKLEKMKWMQLNQIDAAQAEVKEIFIGEKLMAAMGAKDDIKEVQDIIYKTQDAELCAKYVQGESIDWREIFAGERRTRLHLPVYSFQENRCWIEPNAASTYLDVSPVAAAAAFDKEMIALSENKKVYLTGKDSEKYDSLEEDVGQIVGQILGFQEIDVNEHFYQLGGDSIIALQVVHEINRLLNVSIEISDVIQQGTIINLASFIQTYKGQPAKVTSSLPLVPAIEQENYPVSSAQKRLFLLDRLQSTSTSYNLIEALRLKGTMDRSHLEKTLQLLVNRHESLRTSFYFQNGDPVQRIHDNMSIEVMWMEATENDINTQLQQCIQPYDLSSAPLFRVFVFNMANDEYILLFDMHHIISDGTSMGILIREFVALYDGHELPPLSLQYKDYSVWEQEALQSEEMAKQKQFWLEALSGELPILDLPLDFVRPSIKSEKGHTLYFEIDETQTQELKQFTREAHASLFMVMMSAYQIMLSKYSKSEEIAVGTPIAGRLDPQLDALVGMFINTLVFLNKPSKNKTYEQYLNEVKEYSLQAYQHQDFPFDDLVRELGFTDLSRNPLFDTMFIMQNLKIPSMVGEHFELSSHAITMDTAKFDLMVQAVERQDRIELIVEYCSDLFHQRTIEQMMGHYIELLKQCTQHPQKKIGELNMLTDKDWHQITVQFNDLSGEFNEGLMIHQMFEKQARLNPNQFAVEFEDQFITYGELNEKANQLAKRLRSEGVQSDEVVGLLTYHSVEMMIGIMAVLKAGGAYLPIDPEYPDARKTFILNDCKVKVVLTNVSGELNLGEDKEIIHLLDDSLYTGDSRNLQPIQNSRNLMYVIYTSGSTGEPKGVMIEHRSFHNFVYTMNQHCGQTFGTKDRGLSLTNISFDVSVSELFLPLVFGGTLVLYDMRNFVNVKPLVETIVNKQITFAYIPPTILSAVAKGLLEHRDLVKLNKMLVGVESIQDVLLEQFMSLNPDMYLINGYGPTEVTICSNMYIYHSRTPEGKNVPIGKPLYNNQAFILGDGDIPVPVGVAGELCISGKGLARGYIHRPDLTDRSFVPHPWIADERMYRTGDLAKWLPDGNMVYLGRIDRQVKIRGYRIELSEVEIHLLKYSSIQEVVVIAEEDNEGYSYLCAYFVADVELSLNTLREAVLQNLPSFMIPSYFVQINEIPLTANGKIDRKALKKLEGKHSRLESYEAPSNELEKEIASIWREVLNMDEIGIHDSFFELGGQSIQAVRVQIEMEDRGLPVEGLNIVEHNTIKALALKISEFKKMEEGKGDI